MRGADVVAAKRLPPVQHPGTGAANFSERLNDRRRTFETPRVSLDADHAGASASAILHAPALVTGAIVTTAQVNAPAARGLGAATAATEVYRVLAGLDGGADRMARLYCAIASRRAGSANRARLIAQMIKVNKVVVVYFGRNC